jgi:hypothetical protein
VRGSITGNKPRVFVKVGQRFGRLVVMETGVKAGVSEAKPAGWRAAVCQCDCGTTTTVKIFKLMNGQTQSCGCLKREGPKPKTKAAQKRIDAARTRWARSAEGRAHAAGLRVGLTPEQEARRKASTARWIDSPEGRENLARMQQSPERKAAVAAAARTPEARKRASLQSPNRTHGLANHPLYATWNQIVQRCENPAHSQYKNYGGRGIKVCERWHDVRLFIQDIEREIGPRPPGTSGRVRQHPLYTINRIDNNGNYEPGNVEWATAKQQKANQRARAGTLQEFIDAPDTAMSCPTCGEPMRSLSAFDKHRREVHGSPF